MKVIRKIEEIPEEFKGSIITIGNFDGIHLGHRAIFQKLVTEARRLSSRSVVITFDPHPKKILHPERRPFFLLTHLDEKLRLIESIGIDAVVVLPFTKEFATTSSGDFIRDFLWNAFRMRKIYVGYDYTFGKDKGGDWHFLKAFGDRLGFSVEKIEAIKTGKIITSSTSIRLAILDGDVALACRMLGRPYNVRGTVVRGYRRGSILGYPTANIEADKVIPAVGVYAITAETDGLSYRGVLNIGYNPTFENPEISTEVHLIDFQGDIYGKHLEILFIDRLRNEIKFSSADKLVEQIRRDIERARCILDAYRPCNDNRGRTNSEDS
ncbi:MAG: bifunctional riboflavin kinase/FAD synthetase [Deltaproteobacteria bacterium]|nr:bifunctional riboflavin kinase/FAD synthetase [Deltaproteobacteria bacterium]